MGKYFGTDGVRGTFGDALINNNFAYKTGYALGAYLDGLKPGLPCQVMIGRDTRMSGPELCDALTQGLNEFGVHVHDLGIVPTPAVAQAVVDQHGDMGIAVTASHNPAQDNGIKLFSDAGSKLTIANEEAIEALIDEAPDAPGEYSVPRSYPHDGASFYINYLRSLMHHDCLKGWKIVLDLANGATCETSPAVFKHWGAELILIGDNPDGENINSGVGSEYPDALGETVRANGAQLGIAHDGDGDRLVVCDEKGQVVDGDVLLGLFGLYALRSRALREKTLIATIQSNLGLDYAIRNAGGKVERVDVGDRNVAHRMKALGLNIGGESSGHIIFSDFATTGDGLLAAVKLVELMAKTNRCLSEMAEEVQLFPQQTASLKVVEKKPLESLQTLQETIKKIEAEFGEEGRVLVRYSGTEPKIRLLVEGREAKAVKKAAKALIAATKDDLDVIQD
ncbi:MAG: phosphoglucosamine mutase [Verrucomicrobiota bacterium]